VVSETFSIKRPVIAHAIDIEPFLRRLDVGGDAVDQRVLAALGAVDPFEALDRVGAREGAQMMRDRVEIAVIPVRDPGQRPPGIEVDRVGSAAELGRHQQHPVAEIPAANLGLRIDQLALDVMALGFGGAGAAVHDAVRRYLLPGDHRVAEHGGLAGRGGAGRPFQQAAPVEPRRRRARRVGRCRRLLLVARVFLLQIVGEFRVILLGHLVPALEEVLDRIERLVRRAVRVRNIQFQLRQMHGFLEFRSATVRHSLAPPWSLCC
jgi:hypothetical protein